MCQNNLSPPIPKARTSLLKHKIIIPTPPKDPKKGKCRPVLNINRKLAVGTQPLLNITVVRSTPSAIMPSPAIKPRKPKPQIEPPLEPIVTKKPPIPRLLSQLQKEIKERQRILAERYKQKLQKFKTKKETKLKNLLAINTSQTKPLLKINKPNAWGDSILQAQCMTKELNALQLEPNISLFCVSDFSSNDSQVSCKNFNPQCTSTPRDDSSKPLNQKGLGRC